MSVKKMAICGISLACTFVYALTKETAAANITLENLHQALHWQIDPENRCGGYFIDDAFLSDSLLLDKKTIQITGDSGLFTEHQNSYLKGHVSVKRQNQELTAQNAFLYRNTKTHALQTLDLNGNIHLREPNTLIIATHAHYNLETETKYLQQILYRTTLNHRHVEGPKVAKSLTRLPRKITELTAWGKATSLSQDSPKIYQLENASLSTCPPANNLSWHIKASQIILNKNTGRGIAKHAKLFIKNVPILYVPYLNFSIDGQRKSGFLWPILGSSNSWGPYFSAPFYWNMAENYDMVLTPSYLSKRGLQLSDQFRYLSALDTSTLNISVLPNDKAFSHLQNNPPDPAPNQDLNVTAAELARLENASPTRHALFWRDDAHFNDHWSSHIDFNFVSDDYYLRDLGGNLNEITPNQLLQEADLYYKDQHWDFTTRLQAYQTLHTVDTPLVENSYRRFPQLILNADYPGGIYGSNYFLNSELTHFDIRTTPGTSTNLPIGNRLHLQPGISLPFYRPYFYISPRLQLALTDYNLYQTTQTSTPNSLHRAIPIFDLVTKLSFNKTVSYFNHAFSQTLEPQIYYTYIPYHVQQDIPLFDTTVNTLTYDQIFNYNRFTGIDRIGDANQLGAGITTRLFDEESGLEKIRFGIGEIFYFTHRHVTLCNSDTECTDNPNNPDNYNRLSPISTELLYTVNAHWNLKLNALFTPSTKQVNNSTLNFHYQPEKQKIINFGISYAHNGPPLAGLTAPGSQNNLKITDLSFLWPLSEKISAVGRFSHDWGENHIQDLHYGLQYDTCCYAIQLVGGKIFTNLDSSNQPQYRNEYYLQFVFKGLGNINTGSDNGLSKILGYESQFGQEKI